MEVAFIADIRANQVRRGPSINDEKFADMLFKDSFVDGIPLDELGKDLRRMKRYRKELDKRK
ncbi:MULTISPECIES: hypothetical protein [Halobacillus]|uniref:Uncharacterized protein n=2 Tax=Halobacillus TaxID=45667 RepID=A0A1H0EMI3_HALAD|nr:MULTISPECIES: hypothetical protein [Halobacillus]REJ09862.1 hypothetical protein DYE48_07055 [Halobacillus trueperi]SDN83561.1 hypothetical protein SAMN05421677_101242 [Halobacillus aidingensis]